MCTAIIDGHFFGRTLDLEASYGEKVVITGQNYTFKFIHEGEIRHHYAMIGTAHICNGVPLYYDAANEMGLSAAALRFPKFAEYHDTRLGEVNLASFELIPWVLCNFSSVAEAKSAMRSVTITSDNFSDKLPSTPLHWIFADKYESFIVESVNEGIKIYDAPEGILTNAPDFPSQREFLSKNNKIMLKACHIGKKNLDIAGDSSSPSRFIRAAYAKTHIINCYEDRAAISRFFHLMDTVSQPHGFAQNDSGAPIRTIYTSCIDTEKLIYYFTTYNNRQIRAVRLDKFDSDGLTVFTMESGENITYIN